MPHRRSGLQHMFPVPSCLRATAIYCLQVRSTTGSPSLISTWITGLSDTAVLALVSQYWRDAERELAGLLCSRAYSV